MPEPTKIFQLAPVEAPWGNYGYVLMHGLSARLDRLQGLIQLERAGPSIAPITFPGSDILLTAALQTELESSGLKGFTFQPVIKRRIVELDWEAWDITDDEPGELPEGGEPENYILRRPHETRAADELGILSELVLSPGIEVDRVGAVLRARPETWNGADIFCARASGMHCVSAKARRWLEQHVGDYVEFRKINGS